MSDITQVQSIIYRHQITLPNFSTHPQNFINNLIYFLLRFYVLLSFFHQQCSSSQCFKELYSCISCLVHKYIYKLGVDMYCYFYGLLEVSWEDKIFENLSYFMDFRIMGSITLFGHKLLHLIATFACELSFIFYEYIYWRFVDHQSPLLICLISIYYHLAELLCKL